MVSGEGWEEKEVILDFIYQLMKKTGHSLHYSVLLEEICLRFPPAGEDDLLKLKAMFYTWLNLDPRFNYAGKGQWELKSWLSSAGQQHIPALSLAHKSLDYNNGMHSRLPGWERLRKDALTPEKTYYLNEDIDSDEPFFGFDED